MAVLEASVIIPVLNEGHRLLTAVEAVLRQRGRGRFEVIVVDGGSDDGCCGPLRGRPGVRVLEAPGTSAGEARNVGARQARGRVLAFTDADCEPMPGWLQGLLDALDAHPEWAGLGGGLRHRWSGRPGMLEDLDTRASYRGVITSNVAYRAESFRHVGGFDPALRCAEDWDLAWRMEEAGHRIGHAPRAAVVHAPCEDEAYPRFLRKQVWYARHDVPAVAGMALGLRAPPGTGAGRREARRFLAKALLHALGAAMVASLVLAPLGVAVLGGSGLAKAVEAAVRVPEARPRFVALWGHESAKALARGVGTWRGLVDFALERRLPAPRPLPASVEAERQPAGDAETGAMQRAAP